MSSFTRKVLRITFTLGEGQFGESGSNNTLTIEGLRAQASVSRAGGLFRGVLNLRVFGMTADQLNQLSKVGRLSFSTTLNRVRVDAGDVTGMSTLYQGSIYEAWANFNNQPEVSMDINAAEGFFEAIAPIPPTSYKGAVDAAVVLAGLAQTIGFTFENNGASATLRNPYFPGTGIDQINACCDAAGFDHIIEGDILAVWPRGGSRATPSPILVSPETGMVGYPRFNATGVTVETLFNPAIRFGSLITVKSSLHPANGTWRVDQLSHNLASEMPNGEWFTTVECSYLNRSIFKGV